MNTALVRTRTPLVLIGGAFAVVALSVVAQKPTLGIVAAIALLGCTWLVTHTFVSWRGALTTLLVVILFIPIRRYTVPVKIGFALEPYRIVTFLLVALWAGALLVDKRVRACATGFEGPLVAVVAAVILSVVSNGARVSQLGMTVLKAMTFFASFLCLLYLIVSVVRTRLDAEQLLRVLVGGGAIIAVLAVIESRTGWSPFAHMERYLPFLRPGDVQLLDRGAHARAFGPAEHPIALSSMLALLVPPSVYLALTSGQRRWWVANVLLVLGALATISRTGLLVLVVAAFVFLRLRPAETKRLWPLALILVVATHFAMPGTLGTLRSALFPKHVVSTPESRNTCRSGGRLTNLGPALGEVAQRPLFGYGYGTLITTGPHPNACFLDDQWLSTLLESGVFGVIAWLWVFVRVIRRLNRAARADDSARGWLYVALASSLTAFAVGMVTYDAFSFVQVTLVLFVLVGLASVALRDVDGAAPA